MSDTFNESKINFENEDSDEFSNHIDMNSYKDSNNYREMGWNQAQQLEKLVQEKSAIHNQLNNKIVELQTHIVRLTNTNERTEASKAEMEVNLTKSNVENRNIQRTLELKTAELDKFKIEMMKHYKSLEADYLQKIENIEKSNENLNQNLIDSKQLSQRNEEMLNEKINKLIMKMSEKDEELSKNSLLESQLHQTIEQLKLDQQTLTGKLEETDKLLQQYSQTICQKDLEIQRLKSTDEHTKEEFGKLTKSLHKLEMECFEAKHESQEFRANYNELQEKYLDIKQNLMIKEKEYDCLVDKLASYTKTIRDLENSISRHEKINCNLRDKLKSFQQNKDTNDNRSKVNNDEIQRKIEELETKLSVQNQVIEEVNEEISTSRESESTVLINFNSTIIELERIVNSAQNESYKSSTSSPLPGKSSMKKSHDKACQNELTPCHSDGDQSNVLPKSLLNKVKDIFDNYQDKMQTLENENFEYKEKIKEQDRELKSLKIQIRKHVNQLKSMEIENSEKHMEISQLSQELSTMKSAFGNFKQENNKTKSQMKNNLDSLKKTLNETTEESHQEIQDRDDYLHSISNLIKEYIRINNFQNNQNLLTDQSEMSIPCQPTANQHHQQPTNYRSSEELIRQFKQYQMEVINQGNQTNLESVKNNGNNTASPVKDSQELVGNVCGTFSFPQPNNSNINVVPTGQMQHVNYSGVINANLDKKLLRDLIDAHNIDNSKSKPPVVRHPTKNIPEEKPKSQVRKSLPDNLHRYENSLDNQSVGWPLIREVLSNEIVNLLNRHETQKAQPKSDQCHSLMMELTNRDSIIERLLLQYQQQSQNNNEHLINHTQHSNHHDNTNQTYGIQIKNGKSNGIVLANEHQAAGAPAVASTSTYNRTTNNNIQCRLGAQIPTNINQQSSSGRRRSKLSGEGGAVNTAGLNNANRNQSTAAASALAMASPASKVTNGIAAGTTCNNGNNKSNNGNNPRRTSNKHDNYANMSNIPCCCGDSEAIQPAYPHQRSPNKQSSRPSNLYYTNCNNNNTTEASGGGGSVDERPPDEPGECCLATINTEHYCCALMSEYAISDFEVSHDT